MEEKQLTKKEIDDFTEALDAFCKERGFYLRHEDSQGAALIRRIAPDEAPPFFDMYVMEDR